MAVIGPTNEEKRQIEIVKTTLGRWVFLAIFVAIFVVLLKMFSPLMTPIFVGILFSMISMPLFKRLEKKMPKSLAALVTCFGIFICIVAPFFWILYLSTSQMIVFTQGFLSQEGHDIKSLIDLAEGWMKQIPLVSDSIDFQSLLQYLKQFSNSFVELSVEILKSIPQLFFQSLIVGLCVFFFLSDRDFFLGSIYKKIPIRDDLIADLMTAFSETANTMLIANLWACAAQACIVGLAFLILKLPFVILGMGLTLVCAWIPMIGCAPIWIGATIYLVSQGAWARAIAMIVFGVVIASVDNLIRPMILSGTREMHPLVSLLAVLCGVSFFGFVGLFLGPALVAVFLSLIQLWPKMFEKEPKVIAS